MFSYFIDVFERALKKIHYLCAENNRTFGKMNIDHIKNVLDKVDNLANRIGIELVSTPDPDICVARMKVDERNRQPFGYLSGGASLALAETLAGCGSYAICPEALACVGQNVHGNHIHPAKEGETVIAIAKIIHQGKSSHVWQVDIKNEKGDLVSSISVTNHIIYKQ